MKRKKRINAVALVIFVAMAFFVHGAFQKEIQEQGAVKVMAMTLTELALPVTAVPEKPQEEEILQREEEPSHSDLPAKDKPVAEPEQKPDPEPEPEVKEEPAVTDSIKPPQVLIYHTHATESYQPVTEGNFHTVNKTGTVREVGDVMAQRLTELGYQVIHDETIHDHPSYSQSYSRSLETAKSYLEKYPQIVFVIDLHRDAAGYPGTVGKTVSVDGKNAASYGYVIGQGNPNLSSLNQTVADLNGIAGEVYPGFTGKIIEKEYKFNQYISDHHVLLEVGNNEHSIEQAKNTGYYLAEIIGAYLKEQGI